MKVNTVHISKNGADCFLNISNSWSPIIERFSVLNSPLNFQNESVVVDSIRKIFLQEKTSEAKDTQLELKTLKTGTFQEIRHETYF